MQKITSKTTLLLLGMSFFSNGFATTSATANQDIDYQKEAEKYKELYEKYQKLADEVNQEKVVEKPKAREEVPEKSAKITSVEKVKGEVVPTPAKDASKDDPVAEPWKGTDIGVGGTVATGDNATTNVNALANVSYKPMEQWSNKLFFNYVYSTDDRKTTAKDKRVKINKAQVRAETSWDFTKTNGAYGRITYLNDELSTYEYIYTESIGYKRNIYQNESKTINVSLSAGPSLMQSKITTSQVTANEPGFQGTFDFVWSFADKSNFKQNLLYNYDQKNKSIYQSISALSFQIYKNFSVQLTYQLNGTTVVAPGKSDINTLTSTNIMYTF